MLPFVFRLDRSGAAASHSMETCTRSFDQTRMTALKEKPCRGGLTPSQRLFYLPVTLEKHFFQQSLLLFLPHLQQVSCISPTARGTAIMQSPPPPSPPKGGGIYF